MIVDERTYTLVTGGLPEYMQLYEDEGKEVQWRHLGEPVGWFFTEVGTLNQAVHLWRYDTFEERMEKRRAMLADPQWGPFFAKIRPLIVKQENRLLMPAHFSPLR